MWISPNFKSKHFLLVRPRKFYIVKLCNKFCGRKNNLDSKHERKCWLQLGKFIYSLFGLPAFQGLWTNTANLHLCSLLFQTIPCRRRRIITHTVLVPNKPLVFICPPPHQPNSPHVFLYMCILSIYSYIYYKNLHPSQKYCDILSGTEGQDWKQESEHPPFLIM
jgi:hypothetical protein